MRLPTTRKVNEEKQHEKAKTCRTRIPAGGGAARLALVLYNAAGRTSFDPNYSVLAFVGMGAGIVLGIAGSIIRWRPLSFLSYLSFLYGFIQYLVSQANLIANIFYDVDGSTFPPAFYATLAASAGAVVLALVAGIVMKPIQDKQ